MLKNFSIFVIFSFFSESIGRGSSLDEEYRSSLRRSFGSVWDKCSKQTITDGEIKCDIKNGQGMNIETAVCTATCKDGYLLIGKTFDFIQPLYPKSDHT